MEWTRGPTIGRGSTAAVSLATAAPSGELFAVKTTELSCSVFLQKEQHFLSRLCCPRIVKYIGYDISYENNKPMYNLCMEYVPGGTLKDAIQRQGGCLVEPMIRSYTEQVLQGLEYLHMNGLAHCDIKSQNILIGKDGAKIADLGCAKLVGRVAGNGGSATSAISGTPMFMSPEVARGEEQGFAADIWALGCTIVEMATGSTPWPEMTNPVSALYRIGFSGEVPEIPRWLSSKAKDFLSKCLRRDPRERWTAKKLLEHPFIAELDSLSVVVKDFTTSSPNSVLEQGLWDSMEVLECPRNVPHEVILSNSPAERIKRLIGSTISSVSCEPNWTWDEDWITVRSNVIEENEKLAEKFDEFFADEITAESEFALDQVTQMEEFGGLMFDEDLFEYSVDSISAISVRRDFVMEYCSVKDDIVLAILNFESDNENFRLLPSKLLHLNPNSFSMIFILFLQIEFLYNPSIPLILLEIKSR